jgi:uncharacterized RDD family membrane protein YckC
MRSQAANAQGRDVGGTMFCSKCGASVAEGAAFCAACGQPVPGYSIGQPSPTVALDSGVNPAAAGIPAAAYVPPPTQTWQAPAAIPPPPTVGYAGFWLRFVAVIIDFIVIYAVRAILFKPFGIGMGMGIGVFHGRQPRDFAEIAPMLGMLIRVAIISAIIQWLYFSLMESSVWQATLGKKALGLTVTDLEGRRIGFGRATGRYFAKILSSLTLFIGYMMAGFTEKKQALHDIIAGTLVLRKL